MVKQKAPTVEKNNLIPFLGAVSLQTWTKLQKALKGVLNCCKFRVITLELISRVVYKFQCGFCNKTYMVK